LKRKILMAFLLASILAIGISSVSVKANGDLVQLGLCIDGSGSISSGNFATMTYGIAEAIRNNLPYDASVELCVIQFADYGPAVVEIAPIIIDSPVTAEAVATAVEGITQLYEMTSMADGVWLTWDTMKNSPNFAISTRQVINLATDGLPNELLSLAPGSTGDAYDDVEMVVGWAVSEGLDELDAEAITGGADVAWLRDYVVYPQPGYEAPPFAGPGWVRYVADFQEFADTIGEKFEIIIPQERDVEAFDQVAVPNTAEPGDIVDIQVSVRNNGPVTETFDLTCYYDSVEIGTVLVVDLAPSEVRVVTFTLDTTGIPLNEYKIEAWADSGEVITEIDECNNHCTSKANLFVVPELPLGPVLAAASMFAAFGGYVKFKRPK
jgi:hypothetical protein